jgi:hypothetical protein
MMTGAAVAADPDALLNGIAWEGGRTSALACGGVTRPFVSGGPPRVVSPAQKMNDWCAER